MRLIFVSLPSELLLLVACSGSALTATRLCRGHAGARRPLKPATLLDVQVCEKALAAGSRCCILDTGSTPDVLAIILYTAPVRQIA